MMHKLRTVALTASLTIVLAGLLPTTSAAELPDSELNHVSGNIELVESILNGGQHDIRHVVDRGQGVPSLQTLLSVDAADDSSPRIAINDTGAPGVVWHRTGEVTEVSFRARPELNGEWGGEKPVGEQGTDSLRPAIVADSGGFWIGFESLELPGKTDVVVRGITDDFEPFPTLNIIDTTDYLGDHAIVMHKEQDSLWMTWIQSPTEVGWAVYDYETESWGLAQYEPNPDDDVPAARARIRETVLSGQ